MNPFINERSLDSRLRVNNFDLLRFAFAFIVLLVHAHVLSGLEDFSVLSRVLSSEIAVKSFFIVSGFLIFMSYENSSSMKSYFQKRIRRIYPAYFCIVLVCALSGALFSTLSLGEYFSSALLIKYVAANLVFLNFLQPALPGLFENNAMQAVNGALWTLKIEVMFYLLVPFVVMAFRRFGRIPVLSMLYVLSVTYSMSMEMLARKTGSGIYLELQRQLPGQLVFFIAGALGYYYFPLFAKHASWLVLLAIGAFALQVWLPWVVVQPVALGLLVIYLACVFPYAGNFGRYGDFSYGIYILHFPILQLLVAHHLFEGHPWRTLMLAGGVVVVAAFFLWHLVERPFLRKSSHYLVAAKEGAT